jgi:hypothetical protein
VTKVVHCKREKFDYYIGRPSPFGNPYVIGKHGTREEVIKKYEEWIRYGDGKHLLSRLHELDGLILGCWCHNVPCHGHVLIKLVEEKNNVRRS